VRRGRDIFFGGPKSKYIPLLIGLDCFLGKKAIKLENELPSSTLVFAIIWPVKRSPRAITGLNSLELFRDA
jgi:hypothetical protein